MPIDHSNRPEAADTAAIDGIAVVPLPQFHDERGAVYQMIRATDPHFVQFGEIYFSIVHPGMVKAWKRHRTATVNYACVYGCVKLVLYDDRRESRTAGVTREVILGPETYHLVVVPPGVWNGFMGLGEPLSILANCASEPYDPSEFERVEPRSAIVPYVW